MPINDALFSTGSDMWETPQKFFDELNEEFHFTLDACATPENAKCARYFTEEDDALAQSWAGETVFCNPPYSRKGGQDLFVKKAYEESQKPGTTVVMLLPARTDTERFHKYILDKAEVRFLRGRLVFEMNGKPILDKNGRPQSAPFPSMVVVWRNAMDIDYNVWTMDSVIESIYTPILNQIVELREKLDKLFREEEVVFCANHTQPENWRPTNDHR